MIWTPCGHKTIEKIKYERVKKPVNVRICELKSGQNWFNRRCKVGSEAKCPKENNNETL